MTDFAVLVAALAATDDATRKPAEASYEQLQRESPQALVAQLVQLVRAAPDEPTRAFASVLLRRVVEPKRGVYALLDAAAQQELKAQLLVAVGTEPVAHVRRKLCHTVAELAAMGSAAEQPWPELFASVVALSAHGDAAFRESAFVLVAALADSVGRELAPHKESFLTLFTNALNDARGEVQIASLKAAAAFLVTLEKAHDIDMFGFIVTPMLRILQVLLQTGDEATLREVLSPLVQIAEVHPKFFKPSLAAVAEAMLFLVAQQALEDETRELALEVVLSLCESAGAMMRKHAKPAVAQLVPLVIQLQTEVEDDDTWATKFDDPQTFSEAGADDGETLSDAAAAAIDRLATALGGNAVLPAAIPVIEQFLRAGEDWKQRRAALYTTCLLGEGCKAQLAKQLDSVAALVLPFLGDAHARAQYAAVHCVGQLAEDFGQVEGRTKNFQAKFHGAVLPALTQILASDAVPLRTRALAASVVVNFCNPNNCKHKHVAPHAAPLLEALFHALRTTPRQVQEQAITAVASVAKVIGQAFDQYYDIFIPLAKDVLVNAQGDEYGLLRGKAMESIALIGQAVGKARFSADAKQVMDILVRLHTNNEAEGVEIQYVAQACVRIGSLLKHDFVPYLPYVVPPLLKQAAVEPDVVLTDLLLGQGGEEDDTQDGMDAVTLETRAGDKKRLQINTSALQDKLNACNMLYQCALDLEGAFYPYVSDAAAVLLPLVGFKYIDDIRIVSALTLSRLLASAVDGGLHFGHAATAPPLAQQLFDSALAVLLQALPDEEEPEVRSALAEALSALLEVAKTSAVDKGFAVGLALPHVPAALEAIKTVAAESAEVLVRVHVENQQDEDFDADEAAQQSEALELEEAVFRSMVDSIGWLLKTHGPTFFPLFQQHLLPFVTPLLESTTGVDVLRGQAICMVDDVIEHCGAAAQDLLPLFINHLVRGLEDASPAVIQASAYGVGVCAEKTTAAFAPFAASALDKLVAVVEAAPEGEEEALAARDNAASAVAKILLAYETSVDAASCWKRWLTWLPLRTDAIEARDLHARLITWVAQGHAFLVPELPTLLQVFATILLHDPTEGEEPTGPVEDEEEDLAIISEDGKRQLQELLAKLQTQLPADVVQGAWATLSGEQQQALAALSSA